MRTLTALFLGLLFAGTLAAQEVRVTSSFEPSIMRAGETGVYRFTVSKEIKGGSFVVVHNFKIDIQSLTPPAGLQMSYLGQSQRVLTQNSQTIANESHQFRVMAMKEGEYTIPEYSILVDGKAYPVPAATLKVLASSSPTAQTPGEQPLSMELVMASDRIYVGESIPIEVHLYIRRDVQSPRMGTEFPVKVGDAFAVSDFSEPTERQIERGGTIYHELTWRAVVTPYKAGDYPLVFQTDIYAYIPESDRQRGGDPMFNQMFSRFGLRAGNLQQYSLYTNQDDLTVLDLPEEGRPENFSGAIGLFRVSGKPTIDPTQAQVGEPMTLSFSLEGAGNFDRFEAPALADDNGWRVYTPEEDFAPTDRYRYQGRMDYKYVLIPRDESVSQTPAVSFSFFNPDTEKYEELALPSVPVRITPPPPGQRPNIPPTVARQGGASTPALARQPELLPIKTTVVAWGQSMRPLLLSPWFLGAQGVPLAVLVGLALTRRRHNRLLNDPRYAREVRARKALKPRLAAARRAAAAGDHAVFYSEAQRVIQGAVGRLVDQTSEALSADEIDRLLASRGVDTATSEQTQAFLHAGDALKFGGLQRAELDLRAEMTRLETLGTQLMKLS